MIYPKELVLGLNILYSGHFQNTLNFKTFSAVLVWEYYIKFRLKDNMLLQKYGWKKEISECQWKTNSERDRFHDQKDMETRLTIHFHSQAAIYSIIRLCSEIILFSLTWQATWPYQVKRVISHAANKQCHKKKLKNLLIFSAQQF